MNDFNTVFRTWSRCSLNFIIQFRRYHIYTLLLYVQIVNYIFEVYDIQIIWLSVNNSCVIYVEK